MPFGKSKFTCAGAVGRMFTSVWTRMATGGTPDMEPGHTALGQSFFHAGAPKATSGALINFSSFSGIRYPLLRKAIPKAFSLGGTTWQVVHEVSYRRANIGRAEAGFVTATKRMQDTTKRSSTVVYLSCDSQKTKNIGRGRRPRNAGFAGRAFAKLGLRTHSSGRCKRSPPNGRKARARYSHQRRRHAGDY